MATALARTVRAQIPKAWVRTSGSFLNIDINRNCVDMALGHHAGEGTTPLRPIELQGSEIPRNDLNHLKDVVDDAGLSSVVVSWDVNYYDKVRSLSSSVLSTLDGALRESHDSVTTTRPFFMLDGGGRRMGSMCLVKSPSLFQRLSSSGIIEEEDLHVIPGAWLEQYSMLRSSMQQ